MWEDHLMTQIYNKGGEHMESSKRKIGILMSVYMGVVMSIFMTITGVCVGMLPNVIKGLVPPQAMLLSLISGFFVSFCISVMIGFMIPMHKVTQSVTRNMDEGFGKRCVETLISDVIYTPAISLVMVAFAYMSNQRQGNEGPSFFVMLIPSLIACFIVGFILIYIFQPIFMRRLMRKYGPGAGRDGGMNKDRQNKKNK